MNPKLCFIEYASNPTNPKSAEKAFLGFLCKYWYNVGFGEIGTIMKHNTARWVIGNWKMNPLTPLAAKDLAQSLHQSLQPFLQTKKTQVAVAPSVLHFSLVQQYLESVVLCAQDVSGFAAEVGAATGDVSAAQLQAVGAKMALVGHSERRGCLQESHDLLYQKVRQALSAGLLVVFCVGESRKSYESGKTLAVLEEQLAVFDGLSDGVMVAYEPVWAIGTGLTPKLEEVEAVHRHIKALMGDIPVLYGGSVNETNAQSFAQSVWIDGVLVGGASLSAQKFATVVAAFDGV